MRNAEQIKRIVRKPSWREPNNIVHSPRGIYVTVPIETYKRIEKESMKRGLNICVGAKYLLTELLNRRFEEGDRNA